MIKDKFINIGSMLRKFTNLLIYIVLLIGFLIIVTIGYWSISNEDVLEIKNNPVPAKIIHETPFPNGIVFLHVDYCKKVSASGKVRISFISNTQEFFLPSSSDAEAPGCHVRDVPIPVPSDMPPGSYKIKFHIIYQVNPIKQVPEDFESQPFNHSM